MLASTQKELNFVPSAYCSLQVPLIIDDEARLLLSSTLAAQAIDQLDLVVAGARDLFQLGSARLMIVVEETVDEELGRKVHQIVDSLTKTEIVYGQIQVVENGEYHTAFGGAVELGDDDACDARGFPKALGLFDGVLPGRAVEHQENFVRSAWHNFARDFADFC